MDKPKTTETKAKAREWPRTPEGKLQLPNVTTEADREWLRYVMAVRDEAYHKGAKGYKRLYEAARISYFNLGMEEAAKARTTMPTGIGGEDSEWLWDLAQDETGEAIHKETTSATT